MELFSGWSFESVLWTSVLILISAITYAVIERRWHLGTLQRLGYSGPPPNLLLGTLRHFTQVSAEFPDGWKRLFDTYGSQVGDVRGKCLAMYMGKLPCIILSDPDVIKTVAIKDFENFRNRMFSEVGKNKGMIAARDTQWKNARYTLAPSFSQSKIKHMSTAMNKSISLMLDIIDRQLNEGSYVDFLKVFRGLTMEVICKCGLALEVNAQEDVKHPLLLSAIQIFEDYGFNNIKRLLRTLFPSLSGIIMKLFETDFTPCEKAVLQYVKDVIKKRMDSPETGKTVDALHFMLEAAHLIGAEDDDVTSGMTNGHCAHVNGSPVENPDALENDSQNRPTNHLLNHPITPTEQETNFESHTHKNSNCPARSQRKQHLNGVKSEHSNGVTKQQQPVKARRPKLTADDVAANAFLLLLAGYETTSSALVFASYLLAKHPQVQQRLYDEISQEIDSEEELTYEKVGQLQYLDMVLNESLRCYPPAGHLVSREVDKDYEYCGLRFPAKSYLLLPIAYMHYNEELWDDPKTFDPERFHPDRKKDIHAAAFMPFGLGPRQCIGARFATLEAKLAITRLIRRFRLEVCPLTEMDLKTKASILILTPASGHLFLKCTRR